MKCVIALDGRFVLNEGKPASHHLTYQRFWKRYLDVFDSVTVIGRLFPIEDPSSTPIEGSGVSFFPMPGYVGPVQYIFNIKELKKRVRSLCLEESTSAFIIRNSTIGALTIQELQKKSMPYGIEVVSDPYDVFAPGSIEHPLRSFFRWYEPRRLRDRCAEACAASYVTQYALQRRYPPSKDAFSTHYSSIQLPDTALVDVPKSPPTDNQFVLVAVGSLAQMYKAPDIAIDAIAVCVRQGLDLKLLWVGDGKQRAKLEDLAEKLGISDRIHFLGQLSAGDAVRAQLDRADLFVLPSYQEGLPRATIEAMARGLPCIGSTVGGFPELLASEDMVPPGDVAALASKIFEVVSDRERMARMSARNLEKAKDYTEELLQSRRVAFYRYVRDRTEAWLKTQEL